ncbi:MAG: hypothetical protein ABI548_29675 [Polyangiaceae bacterium]
MHASKVSNTSLIRANALIPRWGIALVPVLLCFLVVPAAAQEGSEPDGPAPTAVPPPLAAKAPPAGSGLAAPTAKASEASATTVAGPALAAADASWKFEFHGFIRAPMFVGVGRRDKPLPGQSSTTLHSPVIPDNQYLSWQSSPHNKTDWGELYFSLGNPLAKGTVSIQGYNFVQGSFSNPSAQLGISDGYVDLTPDLGYENVRLAWRVGAFSNKYGSAGRYDAGEYDTYMFGRVHNAGEALHIDFDIDERNSVWVEHGIGAKKPDPNQYNNTRFTMLNHAHVGFNHEQSVQLTAHYLDSWTQSEELNAPSTANSIVNVPDGKMWVAGLDGRFDLGAFGYFYGAYSHVGLKNALTVSRAIEVIHASGGGEFGLGVVDNYLGLSCVSGANGETVAPFYKTTAGGSAADQACSKGNGSVDTLLAQYEFGLTNFLQQSSGGQKFWGEGQDLTLKLYGMYNKVKSDVAANDGIHKLKYGADLAYAALPWLTAAVRFDRLQPNSRIPEQSFAILSPRLVFKSKWITREAITLQYSHYMYNQRSCPTTTTAGVETGSPADSAYTPGQERCVQPPSSPVPPDGFGSTWQGLTSPGRAAPTTRPDENVFKIEATMWW